ncbi:MAG: transposase [Dehalococcoidia bacterium]
MASRLYPATRSVYRQVVNVLWALGVATLGSPNLFDFISLYVTGLILLDERQNQSRITRFLPGRCHDALNRLLRVIPLSTRMIMALLISFAQSYNIKGYLCLDDVVIEKRFSKRCPWTGWTFSTSKGRKVYGLHIVVLLWCSGLVKIPVAFRLWQPKDQRAPSRYRTKIQLAQQMIIEMLTLGLPFTYLTFDCWYNARWFTRFLNGCGVIWVSTLKKNAHLIYCNRKVKVGQLARMLKPKWRKHLGLRAVGLCVYLPGHGSVRLVVTRNGHGRWEYIVTNNLKADLTATIKRKGSRWDIETVFKDAKQLAGFAACQCQVPQAMVRHVAFVLLTYVVLNELKVDPSETVGDVKERLQLEVIKAGDTPPEPLRARTA